ncbi:MAG: hypothetical protein NT154_15275 [Verrucomicrobia bacterium]|nr:hypothetical protein [Verrucomicrobiota bacterium]
MLVWFAWRWRDRHYKTDPARRIRMGYVMLRGIYYDWKASGGDVAVFGLHYRCGNQKLAAHQVAELSRLCLAPETRFLSEAYRRLTSHGATERAYRYAIPARLRAALDALFANRRRCDALERAATRLLKETE